MVAGSEGKLSFISESAFVLNLTGNGLINLLQAMICYVYKLNKKFVMDISANSTLNVAKVCLGFATYNVQLPDIYVSNFLNNF